MSPAFGPFVRGRREALRRSSPAFSLRKLAGRIGVEPSYLSKVERGIEAPPSERRLVRWAEEIGVDPDVLLARAGRIASDLEALIRARPRLMARLVRALGRLPDHTLVRFARDVRDAGGGASPPPGGTAAG